MSTNRTGLLALLACLAYLGPLVIARLNLEIASDRNQAHGMFLSLKKQPVILDTLQNHLTRFALAIGGVPLPESMKGGKRRDAASPARLRLGIDNDVVQVNEVP